MMQCALSAQQSCRLHRTAACVLCWRCSRAKEYSQDRVRLCCWRWYGKTGCACVGASTVVQQPCWIPTAGPSDKQPKFAISCTQPNSSMSQHTQICPPACRRVTAATSTHAQRCTTFKLTDTGNVHVRVAFTQATCVLNDTHSSLTSDRLPQV